MNTVEISARKFLKPSMEFTSISLSDFTHLERIQDPIEERATKLAATMNSLGIEYEPPAELPNKKVSPARSVQVWSGVLGQREYSIKRVMIDRSGARLYKLGVRLYESITDPFLRDIIGFVDGTTEILDGHSFSAMVHHKSDFTLHDFIHKSGLKKNEPIFELLRPAIIEVIAHAISVLHGMRNDDGKPLIHKRFRSRHVLLSFNVDDWDPDYRKIKLRVVIDGYGFGSLHKERTSQLLIKELDDTARWRAPELFKVRNVPNRKVDIYSFGVVVGEMFALAEPYANIADESKVISTMNAGIKPDLLLASVPEVYEELVSWCWMDPPFRPNIRQVLNYLRHKVPKNPDGVSINWRTGEIELMIRKAEHVLAPGNSQNIERNFVVENDRKEEAVNLKQVLGSEFNNEEIKVDQIIDDKKRADEIAKIESKVVEDIQSYKEAFVAIKKHIKTNPHLTMNDWIVWLETNRPALMGKAEFANIIEDVYHDEKFEPISFKIYQQLRNLVTNSSQDTHNVKNWLGFLQDEYPLIVGKIVKEANLSDEERAKLSSAEKLSDQEKALGNKIISAVIEIFEERFSRAKSVIGVAMQGIKENKNDITHYRHFEERFDQLKQAIGFPLDPNLGLFTDQQLKDVIFFIVNQDILLNQ